MRHRVCTRLLVEDQHCLWFVPTLRDGLQPLLKSFGCGHTAKHPSAQCLKQQTIPRATVYESQILFRSEQHTVRCEKVAHADPYIPYMKICIR